MTSLSLLHKNSTAFPLTLSASPFHGALHNWGIALCCQAETKTGEEADRLFALAGEKYQAALKIKPDKYEALNNWGNALFRQAKTKTGEEADRLFAQSKDLLLKAETILPGSAAYNIARLSAIRGQEDECRKWLEKCLDLGVMPSRQHLEKDNDLENIRENCSICQLAYPSKLIYNL